VETDGRETIRFTLVVGCGRLGAMLAVRLSEEGHSVSIVDAERAALAHLPSSYSGRVVQGRAMDLETLERAGVREMDAVVTALADDGENIALAALVQQAFGVARVVARVRDPARIATARGLGVDVVCPTSLAADAVQELLRRAPGGADAVQGGGRT